MSSEDRVGSGTPGRAGPVVVGVDGWKDGWVAAVAQGRRLQWLAYRQPPHGPATAFAALLAEHAVHPIAVDVPIGTSDHNRVADAAARAFLRERGGPWQSVFLTPSSAVVRAFELNPRPTHAQVMAQQRALGRPGTSIQAWNLIAKMVEVRDAVAAAGSTVVEAHPECSLRLLAAEVGVGLGRESKKSGRGAGLRLRALQRVFDLDLAEAPADVPVDDLLDAAALAWTAGRYAAGRHRVLPAEAPDPADAARIVV